MADIDEIFGIDFADLNEDEHGELLYCRKCLAMYPEDCSCDIDDDEINNIL